MIEIFIEKNVKFGLISKKMLNVAAVNRLKMTWVLPPPPL